MVLWDIWSQKCQLLRVVCHWRGQESISSIGRSMPCDPSSIVIYINSVAKEIFTQVEKLYRNVMSKSKKRFCGSNLSNSILKVN